MASIRPNISVNIDLNSKKVPQEGKRNVLITSAIPYVNNVPHLGNIIGCLLSADVFARYCRAKEYNTIYICGTDEYGTATETKAIEEKMSCQALCDKYYVLHKDIYDWFGIATDIFGRSATPKQTEITQEIFWDLQKNGYFYEDELEQLYCDGCQRFLADRFVEGTCPLCGYGDARGDQCDGCGKLINAPDLINPTCKLDKTRPVLRKSHHLYFDLPKLVEPLSRWIDASYQRGKWSENAIDITNGWLRKGLTGRCITRDLVWGTPVPFLKDHPNVNGKVFYVWFDACIGYISITANYTDDWRAWWQADKKHQVQLYQFMGKDNVPFHSVIFPSSLLGTHDKSQAITEEACKWTLAHHISTTEFLNYEDGKFSKSRGIGVFGNQVAETGIPASIWRYYLLMNRPESSDAVFSWDDLCTKINGDLVGNLGNFVNRVLKFIQKNCNGILPALVSSAKSELNEADYALHYMSDPRLGESDRTFIRKVNEEVSKYILDLEAVKLKNGLKAAMTVANEGNAYLSSNNLSNQFFAEQPEKCNTVLHLSVNLIYLLSALLYPYMPTTTESLLKQLNAPLRKMPDHFGYDDLLGGHELGQPEHLFKRMDEKEAAAFRAKFAGKQDTKAENAAAPKKSAKTAPNTKKETPVNRLTEQIAATKLN